MKRTVVAALVALFATACGGGKGGHSAMSMGGSTSSTGATANSATKTIDIDMVDIGYEPKSLSAQHGERIEFVFHNKGKIPHDAFIGDTAAQADHEKEMRDAKAGAMSGDHGMGGTAITVDAGQAGQLTYTFDKTGTIEIGCHQPGHYAAGMKVALTVA